MNTSVNNRKYITSTGMLLNSLKADESANTSLYQSPPHSQLPQHHQQIHGHSSLSKMNQNMSYQQQQHYQQQQQHNYNNFTKQQFQTNTTNFQNQSFGGVGSSPQLISQIPPNTNPMDYFQMKMQSTTHHHQPQISSMMLQDSSSQQQQRWQQKKPPYHTPKHHKQQHQQPPTKKQQQQQSSTVPSSTVTELPETFGLPSNNSASNSKFTKTKIDIQNNKLTTSSSNTSVNQAEILIDEQMSTSSSNTNIISPKQQNGVLTGEMTKQQAESSGDIEIISESSSMTTIANQNQSAPSLLASTATYQYNSDETFKNYLSKTYNNSLTVAAKPQSNFISNLNCIKQILTKLSGDSKIDYYENKLKRCKPYSTVKPKDILEIEDDQYDSDNDEDEEGQEIDEEKKKAKRLKGNKIIIIDDSNEEMHKPWITPELIKLIKHRNLLQSKINENNLNLSSAEVSNLSSADEELIKKFKNLRNKVTKLVKKARKDYLVKYVQENKSKQIADTINTSQDAQQTLNASNSETNTSTILNASTSNVSFHTQIQSSASATSTSSAISNTTNATSNINTQSSSSNTNTATTNNTAVNEITSKLTSSILKNPNNLMTTLYTTYYNQYMQQYQSQQQQAQTLASANATSSSTDSEKSAEALEALQKQAAYYAQQQRTIQTQLEASLSETAEQLIQEIASLAAIKTNQPLVLNQFSHQQHHLHQHHYPQISIQQQQPTPSSLNPQMQHPMIMRHIVPNPQQLGQGPSSSITTPGGITTLPPVPIMPMMAPPQSVTMNVVQPNIFY